VNKKFIFKATGTLVLAGMVFGGPAAEAADLFGSQSQGDGFIAGNAVDANVEAPLAVCGVGAAGAGEATGACRASGPLASSAEDMTTAAAQGDGVATGNAVALGADAPVAACGVGVPLIAGVGAGMCDATGPLATTGNDTTKATGEGDGVLAGNAVALGVDVPVAVCGLAVGLAGVDDGACDATGSLATTGDDTTNATAQGNGVGTGNAVALDADVPVAVCGGGLALLGVATGACG
jgi:hypothetical protein